MSTPGENKAIEQMCEILNNTLTVKLYTMSTPGENKAIEQMCEILNNTETLFPGTNMKMIYKFAHINLLLSQEV